MSDADPIMAKIMEVARNSAVIQQRFGSGDDMRVFVADTWEDEDAIPLPMLVITPIDAEMDTDTLRYVDMQPVEFAVYAPTLAMAYATLQEVVGVYDAADLDTPDQRCTRVTFGGLSRERVKQNEFRLARVFQFDFSRDRP